MRLGPDASGALCYKLDPSRWRAREILEVSSFPGRVGYPGSMKTDASLGYAAMGYRSAEPACESCDAQRSLLGHPGGRATRGHGGGKKELAQRAQVGLCLCCTLLTHVAAPPC